MASAAVLIVVLMAGLSCTVIAGPVFLRAAFAYVAVHQTHVNVGFFDGAALPDPRGLLRGHGRFMRHVRVTGEADVDEEALDALVRGAYAATKAALAQSADGAA